MTRNMQLSRQSPNSVAIIMLEFYALPSIRTSPAILEELRQQGPLYGNTSFPSLTWLCILDALADGEPKSVAQIADLIPGKKSTTVKTATSEMVRHGLVQRHSVIRNEKNRKVSLWVMV